MKEGELHSLLVIAVFVVVFLEIHPVHDGNGRLSRVLTTLLLLRAGYAYVPYSSLESVIERSKEQYYLALRQAQQSLVQISEYTLNNYGRQRQKNYLKMPRERLRAVAKKLEKGRDCLSPEAAAGATR